MKRVIFAALAMFAATQAYAMDPYGMAGCGLGSIVGKEMGWDDGFMQVSASTTNGTAGSQTFGITFGTSNCDKAVAANKPRGKGRKKKKRAERRVYLHYNLAQVKADAARGEGDYIEALAGLFGCQDPYTGDDSGFASLSQKHHNKIFTSDDVDVVDANFEGVLASEKLECAES